MADGCLRRLAAGELSEIIGPALLNPDREARSLRLRRVAEEQYRTMLPADKAVLAAYARGVNAFIETHLDRLPLEFTLLKYDPRPWSAVDSILAGLQMFRNLTTTYRDEIEKQDLLAGGDPAKVNFLFPPGVDTRCSPGRTHGLLRVPALRAANLSWRTTRTWSSPRPRPGIRCISRLLD